MLQRSHLSFTSSQIGPLPLIHSSHHNPLPIPYTHSTPTFATPSCYLFLGLPLSLPSSIYLQCAFRDSTILRSDDIPSQFDPCILQFWERVFFIYLIQFINWPVSLISLGFSQHYTDTIMYLEFFFQKRLSCWLFSILQFMPYSHNIALA